MNNNNSNNCDNTREEMLERIKCLNFAIIELEGSNSCPAIYFDNVYEYDWFNDQVVIQMVKC